MEGLMEWGNELQKQNKLEVRKEPRVILKTDRAGA